MAFDAAGNLYVANFGNGTVSEVTPGGVASAFATGFNSPDGLAFDATGNLYVANASNSTVSKVTPAGVVTTFASGFNVPVGLAFDAAGNLYVANSGDSTVSEVTPAGVVSTFASGFDDPVGLAFDAAGNLYVANDGNNTLSQVTEGFTVPFTLGGTAASGVASRRHGQLRCCSGSGRPPGHHRHAPLRPRPQPDADIHPGHTHGRRRPGQSLGQYADHHRAAAGAGAVQHRQRDRQRDAGTFSIPVTVSGTRPTPKSPPSPPGSTNPSACLQRRQPLRRQRRRRDGERGDARGRGQQFASGFNVPAGLAFDAAGNLYVADKVDNTVSEVTPAGGWSAPFASGFKAPPAWPSTGRQPLRRQRRQQHGERGDARGHGQHLRLRVRRSRRPGLRLGRQPLRRQRQQHGERGDARGGGTARSPGSTPDGLTFDAAGNLLRRRRSTTR